MPHLDRRSVLRGIGGALTLPLTDARAAARPAPIRFLVVGNPFGMHPDHFFPARFGRMFDLPTTLRPLGWLKDRLSILTHTDQRRPPGKQPSFSREEHFDRPTHGSPFLGQRPFPLGACGGRERNPDELDCQRR